MNKIPTPFAWLSLACGLLGLLSGAVLGLNMARGAASGINIERYDAVYREFHDFARPDDSMLVGFSMCRPGGCADWEISALYATDQSAKELCKYYLEKMETRGWVRRVDPGCDRLSPGVYQVDGDLPADEAGIVVRLQIRPTAHQVEIMPAQLFIDAQRLAKQLFSVRWSISCGQATCP